MKLAILLILLGVVSYGCLYSIGTSGRQAVWHAVRPHVLPIMAIVLLVFAGLVAAFYTNAVSIL